MKIALNLSLVLLASAPAWADSGAVVSGPQASPPGPGPVQPAQREEDLNQRWAIRGCPVGDRCHGEIMADLREFELATFPRGRTDSPWHDAEKTQAPGAARADRNRASPAGRVARRPRVARPSQLRPDLPWLDDLEMPDIPVHWDQRIIAYLEFYKSDPRGQSIMRSWLQRQGRYRDLILRELEGAELPSALLYLAMIESSYDPHEYSRVGASGLWQFMPAGGSIYGLNQNRWIDERNDPLLSTRAAAQYLRDLHERFGDWDLVLAAYNAGYGAVIKSISKYNTNDFWQLVAYENGLPWGTSNYVPKFLAAAIVGKNRDAFGFGDVKADPAIPADHVAVPKSVPLAVVARAAGTDVDTIKVLNPQLRKGRTPPGEKGYAVRIPAGRAKLFGERFPQLRGDWDDSDAYVAKHGERFEDIATMHGISRSALKELNGMDSESELRGGMILVVPKVSEEEKRANLARAEDDLYASGVPASDPGEPLMVAVPDPSFRLEGHRQHFYRVVSGDSLYSVARAFSVDRHELAAWNAIDPEAHLHPRMVLSVWAPADFDPSDRKVKTLDPRRIYLVERGSEEHLDEAEKRVGRQRVSYSPKKPEKLGDIGARYGLTAWDMARINQLAPDTIVEPGQEILVYEVIDPKASDRAREQSRAARKGR